MACEARDPVQRGAGLRLGAPLDQLLQVDYSGGEQSLNLDTGSAAELSPLETMLDLRSAMMRSLTTWRRWSRRCPSRLVTCRRARSETSAPQLRWSCRFTRPVVQCAFKEHFAHVYFPFGR